MSECSSASGTTGVRTPDLSFCEIFLVNNSQHLTLHFVKNVTSDFLTTGVRTPRILSVDNSQKVRTPDLSFYEILLEQLTNIENT